MIMGGIGLNRMRGRAIEVTAPLIDYYRAKHQLIEIPALQSPDETYKKILESLK